MVDPPGSPTDPLSSWHEQFAQELAGYARARLGHDQAEEAVQETLTAAAAALADGRSPDEPRAWLFGILRHKVVDAIRRSASDRRVREELARIVAEPTPEFRHGLRVGKPAEWAADPERVFRRKDFWSAFDSSVEGLPLRMRQAFLLREVDGMPSEEVCAALGITPGNLWVLIHRARLRLRRDLADFWEEGV